MKAFYLIMAALGAIVPWIYNIAAIRELGTVFTPAAFVVAGFEGSALMGSVAADFWIGSVAALVWMVVEARRLGMRRWWIWIVLSIGVAWAFALPLFLYFRERRLDQQRAGL